MEVKEHFNSAFQMGKFFGLAPYDNNLQLNTKLVYYSIFLTFLLISFWPAEILLAYASDSFSVAHWFDLGLLGGTYIVAVYKSYRNVNLLQELCELLKKVDDTSSLHCEFKKSYVLRFLVLVLIFVSLLDSIDNYYDKLRFWEYLPLIFTLSFEDQFRQTVMIISTRLDTLSSLIRETDVLKLIKSYYLLYSAYKKLNEIYSLQIFCYVVSVFSYIIAQAYLLAKAFISFSSADDDFKIDIIVYSINFTLRSFQVFLMCHLGSSITNKVSSVKAIVYKGRNK